VTIQFTEHSAAQITHSEKRPNQI